jgi:hypothetical protein
VWARASAVPATGPSLLAGALTLSVMDYETGRRPAPEWHRESDARPRLYTDQIAMSWPSM